MIAQMCLASKYKEMGQNLLRLGINTITTQSLIKKIQNSRKYKDTSKNLPLYKSNSMLGLNRHHMIIIKTRQWNY